MKGERFSRSTQKWLPKAGHVNSASHLYLGGGSSMLGTASPALSLKVTDFMTAWTHGGLV